MISAKNKFCSTPELIENYESAKDDTKQWVCHHRLEDLGFSTDDLKSLGLYFNRPFWELIYLPKTYHYHHHKSLDIMFANYKRISKV